MCSSAGSIKTFPGIFLSAGATVKPAMENLSPSWVEGVLQSLGSFLTEGSITLSFPFFAFVFLAGPAFGFEFLFSDFSFTTVSLEGRNSDTAN